MQTSAVILICLSLTSLVIAEDRKVETAWNPGCKLPQCQAQTNDSYINLQYVKLTGQNDTIHMLFSSIGSFSALLFKTNTKAQLQIDWDGLLSHNDSQVRHSIAFSDEILAMAGYEVASVFEFNDTNGDADITKVPANQIAEYRTDALVWKQFVNKDNVTGVFEGSYPDTNGSFRFTVKYPGQDKRDTDLPHLLLNSESSSIDFTIDSIEPVFNASKFAINIIYLTSLNKVAANSIRTIDDEYTPGTFKLWNAEVSDDAGVTHNYLQWKPIFYYSKEKTLENSTITRQYDVLKSAVTSTGIGLAFFDEDQKFAAMNVSYGLEGDAKTGYYYKQTHYSSWTFSVGLGQAPVEKMSFVVTLVIIVGFGLPALVIVVGLIVMIARKIRNSRQSDFQPL